MFKNKKGANGSWIAVAILIIAGIFLAQSLGYIQPKAPSTSTGGVTTPPSSSNCGLTTTMTYGTVDRLFAPGTAFSGDDSYHQAFINGIDQGKVTDASTKAVSPNDAVEIVYAINSSTYLNSHVKFNAPCGPFLTANQDGNSHLLVQFDKTPTINIFNGDDGNLNSPTDAENINTGEVGKFDVRIMGSAKKAFNSNDANTYAVLVIGVNKTSMKEGEVTFSGTGWESTAVPQNWKGNSTEMVGIAWKKHYALDSIGNPTSDVVTLQVPAEASIDPANSTADFIRVSIYPTVYYKNTITGAIEGPSVVDNTNAYTFGTGYNIEKSIYYN